MTMHTGFGTGGRRYRYSRDPLSSTKSRRSFRSGDTTPSRIGMRIVSRKSIREAASWGRTLSGRPSGKPACGIAMDDLYIHAKKPWRAVVRVG